MVYIAGVRRAKRLTVTASCPATDPGLFNVFSFGVHVMIKLLTNGLKPSNSAHPLTAITVLRNRLKAPAADPHPHPVGSRRKPIVCRINKLSEAGSPPLSPLPSWLGEDEENETRLTARILKLSQTPGNNTGSTIRLAA